MIDKPSTLELILYCAVFATWGSIARTLADNLQAGKKGLHRWALLGLVATNAIISCFAGVLSIPFSKAMNVDSFWTVAIAGLAGYMGVGFITLFEAYLVKKLGGQRVD